MNDWYSAKQDQMLILSQVKVRSYVRCVCYFFPISYARYAYVILL